MHVHDLLQQDTLTLERLCLNRATSLVQNGARNQRNLNHPIKKAYYGHVIGICLTRVP